MKTITLLLIAIVGGFANAFLSAGVHSLFFILLPLLAFAIGYFSSWRRGLLGGFLLFSSYTFAISLIWWGIDSPNLLYPFPYLAAFIYGGLGLLILGALAPMVRKGLKRAGSIAVLIILAVMIGWCGYSAQPQYGYYYQISLQASESLNDIELYLPAGAVSGEPYEELYRQVYNVPGELTDQYLTKNFTQEIVTTEQGQMLKLTIPGLKKDNVPQSRYTANIIFWQKSAPLYLIQLQPKSEVRQLNQMTWQRTVGPVKSHESLVVERYKVPVKMIGDKSARVKLTLTNRTDRSEAVNFTYHKSYPYTERLSYDMQTGADWELIPVEGTMVTEIRGISD